MVTFAPIVVPALAVILITIVLSLLAIGLIIAFLPTVGLIIAGIILLIFVALPQIPDIVLYRSKATQLSIKAVFGTLAVLLLLVPFVGGFLSFTPQDFSRNTVGLLSIAQKAGVGDITPSDTSGIDPFLIFVSFGTSLVAGIISQGLVKFRRK